MMTKGHPFLAIATQQEMLDTLRGKLRAEQLFAILAERHSSWREWYPRVYENVGAYCSPKIICACCMELYMQQFGTTTSSTALAMSFGLDYMREHKMPILFVGRDLAAAAQQTQYPEEVDFREMNLPYEAGAFSFPDGTFLLWARTEIPSFGIATFDFKQQSWLYFNTNSTRPMLSAGLVLTTEPRAARNMFDSDMTQSDNELLADRMRLVVSLFKLLEARPSLYERGERIRTIRKANRTTEFWTPNFLGRRYVRVTRKVNFPQDAKRRAHWIRGHMHCVPCGKNHSERKWYWQEPIWCESEAK